MFKSSELRLRSTKSKEQISKLILQGSLALAIILTSLLLAHDISNDFTIRARSVLAIGSTAYLILAIYLLGKGFTKTANWMLLIIYGIVTLSTLARWGINAPVGILAAGFLCSLPGILMGSRYILPVSLSVIAIIFAIHGLHTLGYMSPVLEHLSEPSTIGDALTYMAVLSIFALISWASRSSLERSLIKVNKAEKDLRAQKNRLKIELDKQSTALRQAQLKEIQQLHKFALLGQSTAATLHDLSNHLSILNLDIVDIRQHSNHSTAIQNAEESINYINRMVQQTKKQLNSPEPSVSFNANAIIGRGIKDLTDKFNQQGVSLSRAIDPKTLNININGNRTALLQIVTILLNNALDACSSLPDAAVKLSTSLGKSHLLVSVQDNGPGVAKEVKERLFSPIVSSKSNGMGVGLYIAKHIAKTQLKGSLILDESTNGAKFTLSIPVSKGGL